jgi:hypothetical protein
MNVPSVRERVRLEGRDGEFIIVYVDRERQVADLIAAAGELHLEEDVPFSSILPPCGCDGSSIA